MVQNSSSSKYFEDFEVGQGVTTSGRSVTETDVVMFAGISGDHNPLHVNAEYARTTPFGERIAHGVLGLAIATGLAERTGLMATTVEAFLGLDWKFRAPIKIGDTIYATLEATQVRAMGDAGGVVVFNVAVHNQRGETVQRGQWTVLVKRRPQQAV
jgi:acyl dehydratase